MKTVYRKFTGSIVAILAVALSASASAATIFNGDFGTANLNATQIGTLDTQGYVALPAGSLASSRLTGWKINGGGVDYVGHLWQGAGGSLFSIQLGAGSNGGISQTFSTTAGDTYQIQFELAGNPLGSPQSKTVVVTVAGEDRQLYDFSTSGKSVTNMGWAPESYSFTADGSSAKVTFSSYDGPFLVHALAGTKFGPAIDNVRLVDLSAPVPEPAAWALMLLGFGAVGAGLRVGRRGRALAA